MDKMFTVHKKEFIAAIESMIDMLQNSLDLMEVKAKLSEEKDPKMEELSTNIKDLNRILINYKNNNEIQKEDESKVVGALATTAVLMDYLADNYAKAAKRAKVIIANIQ